MKISLEDLLSLVPGDNKLEQPFKELKLEQRFVNVLFDEAKLTSSLRYTGGHAMEHATDNPGVNLTHLQHHHS